MLIEVEQNGLNYKDHSSLGTLAFTWKKDEFYKRHSQKDNTLCKWQVITKENAHLST